MENNSKEQRVRKFFLALALTFFLVFGFLPILNKTFSPLGSMAETLEETGIDPSRYYYTDVEQVREAELYLQTVLDLD